MSSIKRWFDLQDEGAKLDRRVGPNGSGYLELTFANEQVMSETLAAGRVEAMVQTGWVKPSEGTSIRNYGDFRDFTEIARALAVVFGDEAVDRSIASREDLRQGEVLEGVDRPVYVGREYIDLSLKFLPDAIRSRAFDMIEKARERHSTFRGASLGATGGKLWEVAQQVSTSTGTALSTSLAKVMAVRYDDETFEQIEALSTVSTDTAKNQIEEILRRIEVDDAGLRSLRKKAIALGREGDEIEVVAATEYVLNQADARNLVLDLDAPQAAAAPMAEGFRRDVHGFKFEVSADTTTLAAREYQARLTAAISYVAETFGMEPADAFEPNTRIRVVQGHADAARQGVQIQTRRSGTDANGDAFVDEAGAIVFSQATLGVALHEICHAISRRLGDEPEKFEEILQGSGLMAAYEGVLSEGRLSGVRELTHNPDYVEYLRDPEEVFARLLENALKTQCIEQHGNLDPLGGHAIAGHHENYAPLASQIMDRTIQIVRNYGASRGVMIEIGQEVADQPTPPPQPASRNPMRGR